MSEFPRVQSGKGLGQISAQRFNAMVARVEELTRKVRTLDQTTRAGAGNDRRHGTLQYPVVITKTPAADAKTVAVRRIGYQKNPPEPCVKDGAEINCHIVFVGIEFEAQPFYGKIVDDYKNMVWNGDAEGIDDTTRILTVSFDTLWYLNWPNEESSAVRFARLYELPADDAEVLKFIPVKRQAQGTFVDDLPAPPADQFISVECFPGMSGYHFLPLWRAPVTARQYAELIFVLDRWYAVPIYRGRNRVPTSTYPEGHC